MAHSRNTAPNLTFINSLADDTISPSQADVFIVNGLPGTLDLLAPGAGIRNHIYVHNNASGPIDIAPNGTSINGVGSLNILVQSQAHIAYDGTVWWTI